MSNLLSATKSLVHSIWNQPQDESDDKTVGQCVKAIRDNVDSSDPIHSPDPIALVSVFATMLYGLVPKNIIQRCKEQIYEMICELAGAVKSGPGQLSTWSRKRCVEEMDPAFWQLYLRHGFDSPSSITLYSMFSPLQSKAYKPSRNYPVLPQSLPAFIRLIKSNTTSAAFSLLIMYSIRSRTLVDHPDSFDNLFGRISESEKPSYDIGKLTISSLCLLQPDQNSQGTSLCQTYFQQQSHLSIPSGNSRKTHRMAERLENVSTRFGA